LDQILVEDPGERGGGSKASSLVPVGRAVGVRRAPGSVTVSSFERQQETCRIVVDIAQYL
jgi:hypothetical protein